MQVPLAATGNAQSARGEISVHDTAHHHNHQLRHVLDTATDAYVALDGDAVIVDCNPAAEHLFGWSRSEMLGAVGTELIPHTLNHESPTAPASVAGGPPRLVGTVWRRDGTQLQVEVVVWTTEQAGRSLWHCLCRDISGRVNRLHELAVHADRLNEAQRMAGVGSWEWDLESGHTQWSPQLYAMLGLDPRRSVSMSTLLSRLHADDNAAATASLETGLREGGSHRFEARLQGLDGAERWLDCRGEVWLDHQGVAVRAAGTVQDISDRKAVEAERDGERALLSLAFEDSALGCFLFRGDSGMFRVNAEMGRILGVAPDRLLGADPRSFGYVDGADIAATLTELIEGRLTTMALDGALVRSDGTVVRVAAHAVLVADTPREPAYVFGQWCDTSPRTALEPTGPFDPAA